MKIRNHTTLPLLVLKPSYSGQRWSTLADYETAPCVTEYFSSMRNYLNTHIYIYICTYAYAYHIYTHTYIYIYIYWQKYWWLILKTWFAVWGSIPNRFLFFIFPLTWYHTVSCRVLWHNIQYYCVIWYDRKYNIYHITSYIYHII